MEESYSRRILALAEKLIPSEDILVETCRPDDWMDLDPADYPADVRLAHRPTGLVVECAHHATQIRNKTEALLRLRLELDAQARS